MDLTELFIAELTREAETTRRVLPGCRRST